MLQAIFLFGGLDQGNNVRLSDLWQCNLDNNPNFDWQLLVSVSSFLLLRLIVAATCSERFKGSVHRDISSAGIVTSGTRDSTVCVLIPRVMTFGLLLEMVRL